MCLSARPFWRLLLRCCHLVQALKLPVRVHREEPGSGEPLGIGRSALATVMGTALSLTSAGLVRGLVQRRALVSLALALQRLIIVTTKTYWKKRHK